MVGTDSRFTSTRSLSRCFSHTHIGGVRDAKTFLNLKRLAEMMRMLNNMMERFFSFDANVAVTRPTKRGA